MQDSELGPSGVLYREVLTVYVDGSTHIPPEHAHVDIK